MKRNLSIPVSLIRSEVNVSLSQNPKMAGAGHLKQVHLKRTLLLLLKKKEEIAPKLLTSEYTYPSHYSTVKWSKFNKSDSFLHSKNPYFQAPVMNQLSQF